LGKGLTPPHRYKEQLVTKLHRTSGEHSEDLGAAGMIILE